MNEKFDRDPKELVGEFKEIVDENGFVKFDDYGAKKSRHRANIKQNNCLASPIKL